MGGVYCQVCLILIELHTRPPDIAAKNIGSTAAIAYDANHEFSDQYILEIASFLKIFEEAGVQSNSEYFSKFPDSDLATVSIH
ncbi:AprA-related methyltransferase [Aquimarina sp. M1]